MTVERFEFHNLADLRDWLNRFDKIDLATVDPDNGDYFTLYWIEKTLSDGSTVYDASLGQV